MRERRRHRRAAADVAVAGLRARRGTTPKVTSWPAARGRGRRAARRAGTPATSRITWSAGSTSSSASPLVRRRAPRAPRARWPAPYCGPPARARSARGSAADLRAAARRPGSGALRCTPRAARAALEPVRARSTVSCSIVCAPDQRQQLLRVELARQRPQPRAGAAGQDDRDQHGGMPCHGVSPPTARLAAADGVVLEAQLRQQRGIVEVAAVEDHRRVQQLPADGRSPGCGTPATR